MPRIEIFSLFHLSYSTIVYAAKFLCTTALAWLLVVWRAVLLERV